MPASKRRAPAAKGGKAGTARKKGKKAADEGDGPEAYEDLFLAEDDRKGQKQQQAGDAAAEEDDDAEARETAEEKRLRLARAYLQQVQAEVEADEGTRWGVTGGSEDEETGSSDEDDQGPGLARDRLAQRLKHDAAEASGRVQRKLAHLIQVPDYDARDEADTVAAAASAGHGAPSSSAAAAAARAACFRGHRLPATAVALASDDSFAISVSKDGSILKWDLVSMKRTRLLRPGEQLRPQRRAGAKGAADGDATASSGPDWVKRNPRQASRQGLFAVALSSDNKYLAVGGGDRKVHIFDAQSGSFLQSFPGHRDAVSALCFRDGTHQLFSASFDRTVKLWSIDDRAYMDTLFGHQAEVLSLDVQRAERALTGGNDHSCRVWKVPEESQLVFRAPSMSTDCVRMVSQSEFLSGGSEGLQVWNQLRKKPVSALHAAHGLGARQVYGGASAGCMALTSPLAPTPSVPDVTGWVQSLAVCRNSDLAASGASDGTVRLWRIEKNKMGSAQELKCIGGLPVRGCVNGLALSRSGQLLVGAVGQEPRLGRWMRDSAARNGIIVYRLESRA